MQEAIMQLGDVLLRESDLLSNMIQKINPIRKGKQLHVLKFNFLTEECELKIDANEEMDEKSAEKYFYIGSADGNNLPQWYVTSSSSKYHLTETINNLSKTDLGEKFNRKVKSILDNFYVNLGNKVKTKYRYVLDLKKFDLSDRNIVDIFSECKTDKEIVQKVTKEFEDHIKEKFNIKPDEIGLYTILLDNMPICNFTEYREAVLKEKTGGKQSSKSKKTSNLYCNICGSSDDLSIEFPKTKLKFYTTNQVIFASNLKDYGKNMVLCKNCLNKVMAGENYVMNYLSTRLASFTVYLIPHFVFDAGFSSKRLGYISSNIINSFNSISNAKAIGRMEDAIQNMLDERDGNNYFTINMLFYRASQKATKVQRLIKDVNPFIFKEINSALNSSIRLVNSAMGYEYRKNFKLENIYYLTPIRIKKGTATEYNNLLDIYDCIFTRRNINKNNIIKNLLEDAKIEFYSEEGFNIKSNNPINYTILDGNIYLKFLEQLGCLKGGESLDTSELKVKDDIKNYIKKMSYDEQQTAMFLLGYLIGEIGNVQSKGSDEKRKPILNKLNFAGIDKAKMIRLSCDVFNKLNQEKIRQYNDVTYGEFKRLLDQNINNWKLDKHENLFYILSGYSYSTTKYMTYKKVNGGVDNE